MATTALIPLAEYLETAYRPDREYIDGEILERNLGRWEHSHLQALLATWFVTHQKAWGILVATEQRLQTASTRIRIPDLLVVPRGPQPDVTVDPPLLVIEILSPDDTYSDTQRRASDYLTMGVQAVWIIDPATRSARQCTTETWTATRRLEVPDTAIFLDLDELFAQLNESLA